MRSGAAGAVERPKPLKPRAQQQWHVNITVLCNADLPGTHQVHAQHARLHAFVRHAPLQGKRATRGSCNLARDV
eukprot:8245915-Lingulodinium_polyedra.AAC.1